MKKANNNNVGKMEGKEWEMRPGGMLVQKRNLDSQLNSSIPIPIPIPIPFPSIKVLVKFGSSYHEININSHATFGELKKMVAEVTGLHPQDQKLIFNDKEGESNSFLDVSGVKNGSRILLVQDSINQDSRTSSLDKALKSVAHVSLEIDKLVSQVTAMESVISKGGRVTEKELLTLIELFMSQLIKLDAIVAGGDIKSKRKTQVVRIQRYLENLDRLKAQNAMPSSKSGGGGGGGGGGQFGLIVSQQQGRSMPIQQQREQRNFGVGHGHRHMLTSKWEKY